MEPTFAAMGRPHIDQYDPFYKHYIDLTTPEEATALPAFYNHTITTFFSSLTNEMGTYAYAPDKWSLNQMLQHLLDVERVFVYRLLWIVRGNRQPLPGFDENSFAKHAPASHRTLGELTEEWLLLRQSTDRFIAQLSTAELACKGVANGSSISANALCFIIYGHILHHIDIIETRYLSKS
jgi:uncharacterized damage-inducible protein DinB